MPYYRSTAYRISQGFQKVHIFYFMTFLLITMYFQSLYKQSAKTNDKGKRLCTGNPEFSTNQPQSKRTESVVRMWNPELFHISARGPWSPRKQRTRRSFLFRRKEGTSTAGKLMGSLRGTCRRPEASRPHAQASRWRTCRRRRPSGGSSARLRCAGRRVRRGRGGGACGCGYGGMGERERLRPELAGGHGESAAQERRERVREGRERVGND
jgi:hypothetical protein